MRRSAARQEYLFTSQCSRISAHQLVGCRSTECEPSLTATSMRCVTNVRAPPLPAHPLTDPPVLGRYARLGAVLFNRSKLSLPWATTTCYRSGSQVESGVIDALLARGEKQLHGYAHPDPIIGAGYQRRCARVHAVCDALVTNLRLVNAVPYCFGGTLYERNPPQPHVRSNQSHACLLGCTLKLTDCM